MLPRQEEQWQRRAEAFQQLCSSICHLHGRFVSCASRALRYDLHRYLWDLRTVVLAARAFALWMGTSSPRALVPLAGYVPPQAPSVSGLVHGPLPLYPSGVHAPHPHPGRARASLHAFASWPGPCHGPHAPVPPGCSGSGVGRGRICADILALCSLLRDRLVLLLLQTAASSLTPTRRARGGAASAVRRGHPPPCWAGTGAVAC